ncbi:ATP-binding protein [Pseudodesulfovibrio sp.]|uniref:ATP-binding protein n=1 Tax=unclassified Pseudodesulfovibrio TaxID=2661612 RepID=UPI003B00F56C
MKILPDKWDSTQSELSRPDHPLVRRAGPALKAIITVIVLPFAGAVIAFNLYSQSRQLDERIASISQLAETSLATAVWQVDHASARDFINALVQNPGVAFAQVVTGKEVLATGTKNDFTGKSYPYFKDNGEFLTASREIRRNGDWIGTFHLAMSKRGMHRQILINAAVVLLLSGLLILIIDQAILVKARIYVFNPLERLEQAANAIAEGDLSTPIETGLPGELGRLAHVLDEMRISLRSLIGDLREANTRLQHHRNELEKTVRARTDELNRKNDSLSQAIGDIRRAKQEADVANTAKSQFLASMSHEIRTPMNAILGMADILWETELTGEQKRYVQVFRTAGENLLAILNDILDLSRIEAGRLQLEEANFSLRETVGRAMTIIEPKAEDKGLQTSHSFAPDVPDQLRGDANRLFQVLINLLDNAVKFTAHGSVRLEVEMTPGQEKPPRIQFSVSDTGCGIPPGKLADVFEAFTQADGSPTREFGGTGLGLTISRQLVEMMQGRIWVESTPGKGSVFHFTARFETIEKPETERGEAEATPTAPVSADAPLPSIRILMVEDSKYNAFVIQTYLKDTPCKLTIAENGRDGLAIFTEEGTDLVLMDIQMPDMDGYEAMRAMRNWERDRGLQPTPIVALTAHALPDEATRCLAAGADVHLPKPVKKSSLFDVIRRMAPSKT